MHNRGGQLKALLMTILFSLSVNAAQSENEPVKTEPITQQATNPKPEEKPIEPAQTVPDAPKWRFTLGAGLMLTTSDLEAKNGRIYNSTGSVNVSTSATVTRANSLFIEIRRLQKFGWGAQLGAKYEFERETQTVTITGGGSTVSAKGGGKSQITTFYGNAVYQWDQFYLPFGLNYSQVTPKGDSDPSVYSKMEPDMGMQFGLGLNINENLSGELMNWLVASKQIIKSSGTTWDVGRYTATSWVLALKYSF